MTTANSLKAELQSRGYRADVLYTKDDPDNQKVDVVRVWAKPGDRYPTHCVLAPLDNDDWWTWGGNFEYAADPELTTSALAESVIETL